MSLEIDPIYFVYLLVAVSAGLMAEGVYLLCFSGASYRQNVNRRLRLLRNEPNRENILLQLRKERGLTGAGNYRLGIEALNRLVLQSGLTFGLRKLLAFIAPWRCGLLRAWLPPASGSGRGVGDRLVLRHRASLPGVALAARASAEGIRRPVS
jgi:Flp pilus assembly protein TadB